MPTLDEWLNKTRPVSAGNNLLAGSELNPDAAAEALKQARRNNLPPSLTGDTPDPGLALRNQMSDAADTLRSSPGLDKWIASQPYQVAGFVRDGLKDMGTMEALVNSFKRGVPALKSLLPSVDMSGAARDLNEIEQISARIASGVESEQDLLQYPLFNKVYAGLPVGERGRDQLLKAWTDYRTKAVPAAQERLARSTVEVARLQAQRAGIPLPAVAERVSRAETFGEGFRAIAQDPIKFIASVGPESLVQSAPSLLAAIPASIAGGPIGAGAAIGGGSFVTDYAASILDGLGSEGVNIQDPEAVRKALRDPALLGRIVDQATRRAAVVGAFDAISGGLAGKTLLPKTVVARFGEKSLATELANIALQTPLQGALGAAGEALGQVAAGQEIRPGDVLAEAFGEFFGAPVEVVSASAGRLLARAEEGASAASTAQNNARLLGELQTLADASVVRQRDVETFEGFLQTVTQDTPVESLFIDAQTLIDSGLAEKLADQSPTVAEQLPQAQAGTMIRIPTAEVMGRFNQDLAVLLPEMRTDPNGMSQKEADEYVATRGDQLRAEVESVLSQSESDQAAQEARGRVRDTVSQELMATGRVTQDVADNYALLTSTFYHVMGRRMGMDAEQLFGQERLRVAGAGRGEFEQVRQPVASLAAAEQAIASGSRVIATTDAGEVDVTNAEDLQAYTPEQLSVIPAGNLVPDGTTEIEVDGQMRPALNSEGKLIHPTIEGIRNFWRWFGDSQINKGFFLEDGDKSPMVMYHGTRAGDITEFRPSQHDETSLIGVAFSPFKEVAEQYAKDKSRQDFQRDGDIKPNIIAAYIQSDRIPTVSEFYDEVETYYGRNILEITQKEILAYASENGISAIDTSSIGEAGEIFVLDPKAIKSVSNVGTFSPTEANVYKQGEAQEIRGSFSPADLVPDGTTEIEVDGQMRPALNSEGKLIHPTVEGIRNFWRWFGDSKVVDAQGRPLVVYHGSAEKFGIFDKGRLGENTQSRDAHIGFHFSDNRADADLYAEMAARRLGTDAIVRPFYLSLKNPLVIGFDETDGNAGDQTQEFLDNKMSAKEHAENAGHDGIIYLYGTNIDSDYTAIAFDKTQIKSSDNIGEFSLTEANVYKQGQPEEIRGSFSPAELTIRLTKAQDLSTFLHESGHFYLHMLVNLASRPDAPEDVRKDAETILNWFGIKSTPEMSQFDVWLNMTTDEQRPSHERFARGFEVYLAEGKAPSTELQPMFDRFRSWLLNVYRALMERAKAAMGKQVSFGKAMQAELNDEVRAVFDRMLATQEEIEAKEAAQSLGMMFKTEAEAQKFGIDWKAYQAQGEAATQQAITDLTAKSVQDMKWLENARSRMLSKLQREERETRRSVRSVVRPEIMSQPIYQAWTYLTGTLTDDPNAEPASRFDAEFVEQVTASKEVVAQLRRRGMVADYGDAKKGFAGEHPDVVAETFGFSSGYELIQAILAAPKPEEAINAETDARMLRDFSDLATEQGRNDAVNAALANDARARMVETELAALEKAMSPTAMIGGRRQRTLPGAARAFARSVINRLKIRDVRVGQFSASASRAAKNADAAVKRGNLAEAALEKRNQLVNNYAAKFAGEALDNVKSGLAYLKKFAREGTRKNIDVEYLDQIDRILERFDLRQKSLRDLDRRAALAKFIEDQRELGIEPDLPEHITNEAQAVNYKNLTVEEFAGLVDSVRQIEHFGRLKRKLLLAKDKREFAALMAEIRESVIANDRGRVADNQTRTDLGSILTRAFKTFTAAHRKMASIVYELDGFKDGGPLWDALIRTANERGNWEANKQAELTGRLAQLLKALPRKRENRFSKGIYFAKIGRSLNQEGRLSVALNWGNEGNRQRLMDGYGWTEEGVQQVLDSLTQGEWDFVQGVWDTFESLRPDIAKVERDLMGKEPEWVQAVPVQTQFGTYRGGYYPAIYDPAQSLRAEQMEAEEQAKRQLRGARTAATVRSNFVKGRAAEVKGRPLLLTMDATFNGLTDVVHYLAYKEWLIDANRILRAIDPTIRERYGSEMVSQLRTAVEAIAAGEATNPHALDKPLRHIRIGSMVAGLGFNLVNAIMQPLGLTQSIVRIGPRYVAQGVAEFAKNPVKLATTVLEKSVFMQNRKRTQNRELNDLRNNLRGQTETRQFIDAAMFLPMTAIQMTVDIPTWWGAYQKAQTEGFDEDTSIQIADQAVLASQGGGQAKDLAAIQRGGEFVKLFTVFYGFFNTAYNLGVERIRGTNPRSPSQIARLATDLFLIYSVPAVMGMFIKDAFKIGDEDDEEEIAKKLAAEQVSFLFGTMVGVREAAGAAQIALGLSTSGGLGYNGPAGLRLFNELNKFAQQANQGELDRALVRTGVNVAGIALHLPSAQINRTIDGVVAMSEGRTQNPVALIGGAPPQ